jgi:8-oxo-dGTP diphosphatase
MGILDGWRFCPRCGKAGEHRGSSFACAACGYEAWANSVPGVHALIERNGHVLLGRRAFDPGAGCWGLPGGFLDEGERPGDGLRREVREETGLDVEPGELFGTWMSPHGERTVLVLVYRATVLGGTERAADDVTELAWFSPSDLPGDVGPAAFAVALSAWRDEHP